jgi:uncharacterized C2H2 Zn-finger protein
MRILRPDDMNADLEIVKINLDAYLRSGRHADVPEDFAFSLKDPISLLIASPKAIGICRKDLFCPYGCTATIETHAALRTHIQNAHYGTGSIQRDLTRSFIEIILGKRTKIKFHDTHGVARDCQESIFRCPEVGCRYVQKNHDSIEKHLRTHQLGIRRYIEALGWFWGSIRYNLVLDAETTIEDAIGKEPVMKCLDCGEVFQDRSSINRHFTPRHANLTHANAVGHSIELFPRISFLGPEEEEHATANVAPNETIDRETQQGDQEAPRGPRPSSVFVEESRVHQRQLEEVAQRDEAEIRETRISRQIGFRQKKAVLQAKVRSGVNIPPLYANDMRRLTKKIIDLFEQVINPQMCEVLPEEANWDEWEAFEGAYEDSMDQLRTCIMKGLNRNPERIYGQKPFNAQVQAAREKEANERFTSEMIKRKVGKFRDLLEEIDETQQQEETAEVERRKNKFTKRFGELSGMISREVMLQAFDTTNHESNWLELNQSGEQRARIMDWLDSMITTEALKQINAAKANPQMRRVQESYRTSKSITMRRYINQQFSPPCPIDKETITEHFRETWSPPSESFIEAEPESEFFLEKILPGRISDEMELYMLNEDHIAEVIQSRDDLSASGIDGISYRIFKAAGQAGVKFLRYIIGAAIRCGKVMGSWKEARTILLFKKGDQTEVANWRPITITNCIYRIFTCLMARAFATINAQYHIYSDNQKGFIRKTNGCSEHSIMLNELYNDAARTRQDLVITTIDFSNAFGSVPHELIMSTMKQIGFPEWVRQLVKDMYEDASSTIEVGGKRSEEIGWRKGVKQGCPLSPLLFNLCLEPLLQAIMKKHKNEGYPVNLGHKDIRFPIHAYADDVAFISNRREGNEKMLDTLEAFTRWARMEVNNKKCETSSYIIDDQGHRRSIAEALRFRGEEIPNLTFAQSMKYLGVAVGAHQTIKFKAVKPKFRAMRDLLDKVMNSGLLTVQKIDAVKTFVLPSLDYPLLNGAVAKKDLTEFDKHVRAAVNKDLKVSGLPIECHHASKTDGGLSMPRLEDRGDVLTLTSFAQIMSSKDAKVQSAMRQFTEGERLFRRIEEDARSKFLNWKEGTGDRGGTATIIQRARKACESLDVSFQLEGMNGIRISGDGASKVTNTGMGIGRFLTQQIIRPRLITKLISAHPQHGAAFVTLKGNECSNQLLTDIYTKRTNAFFRFMVAGRADCLATGANVHKWQGAGAPLCTCERHEKQTFAHILNRCVYNTGMMTERHNKIGKVVRDAIGKLRSLEGAIHENTPVPIPGLNGEVANLRPDMTFIQRIREDQVVEIIEFTCPYGYMSRGRMTLERAYEQKRHKYEALAREIRRVTQKRVRVTAVVVSSMGAVYEKSLDDLCRVLDITDKKAKMRLGRRMSEEAILGSYAIWRRYVREDARTVVEFDQDVAAMIREEQEMAEAEPTIPGEDDEEEAARNTVEPEPPEPEPEPEAEEEELDLGLVDWSAEEDETREFDPQDQVRI